MPLIKRYAGIISIGSMIGLLIVASFFDNLVHALRRHSNLDGEVYFQRVLLSMWFTPFLFFVLAICLLLLFWFMVYQGKRNILIHVFFIVIGIGILFIPPLSYFSWWPVPLPYFLNWPGNDGWFLLGTSAFVAAIGVMGIILPKEKFN